MNHCAPVLASLTEDPPVVSVGRSVVLVALRFHTFHHPLVSGREVGSHLVGGEAVEVDHVDTTWPISQVAAVAVSADVSLKAGNLAQP